MYVAITVDGYWGKGETVEEAAKNCNVHRRYKKGCIYYFPEVLVDPESVRVDDMGHVSWSLRDETIPPLLMNELRARFRVFFGDIRRYGTKVEVRGEVTNDGYQV